MKVAIITDTHFGARSDSVAIDRYFEKFYEEVFFPTIKSRDIEVVLHLGDVFDRRKYINYQTLQSCRRYFFDRMKILGIRCFMLAGNHDTYFKNTNNVNSPDLLLQDYDNITVIDGPCTVDVGGGNEVCFLPWICAENYEASMQEIDDTKSTICMGHLEIAGYPMWRGQDSHDGMDPGTFRKFEQVFSGHFHHRSTKKNITYLGNPYEMFWNDYEDPRGFNIFDFSSRELEHVINTNKLFVRYVYDDEKEDPLATDTSIFASKFVKLVVANKKDFYKFDQFIDRLYKENPLELKIIEDFSEFEAEALDDEIDVEDTFTLLSQYVDAVETDVNKDKVKSILRELYIEAQNQEETT
jgi:DNA repair exonuclease SbcCD nuclease subunit